MIRQLLDLPGIIEGAKDGKGRGRQVRHGLCALLTCNCIFHFRYFEFKFFLLIMYGCFKIYVKIDIHDFGKFQKHFIDMKIILI